MYVRQAPEVSCRNKLKNLAARYLITHKWLKMSQHPIASDRCAVFMERDISQLLNVGYSTNEILATALHSVTENYMQKVATEASIGNNICFQGATAKNKSLIAAFEQRLRKPIYVSKYCHLTESWALLFCLRMKILNKSEFRGIDLFREEIAVDTETCKICPINYL